MSKNILFISPTPTHPQNAGNRIRILKMVEYYISQGHNVYFVYSNQEQANIDEMKEYWGDKLFVVPYAPPEKTLLSRIVKKIYNKLDENNKYLSKVDDFYNVNLDVFLKKLLVEIQIDLVIAEYIFLSKALLNFTNKTLKIIDTHDVMTNRHQLFLAQGKKPVWYSTTANEERKALNRADKIIAIQDKEQAFFSRLTSKPVVTIGHLVDIKEPSEHVFPRKSVLFLGSDNPSNLIGINVFITEYLPILRQHIPDVELLLVGSICRLIPDQEGVKKMGEIPDIESVYNLSDIVINPLTLGTGLKIKSIEALGYSKLLITTSVGAEGLENGINNAFILADNPHEFSESLKAVMSDSNAYRKYCSAARQFALSWNETIKMNLNTLLA